MHRLDADKSCLYQSRQHLAELFGAYILERMREYRQGFYGTQEAYRIYQPKALRLNVKSTLF